MENLGELASMPDALEGLFARVPAEGAPLGAGVVGRIPGREPEDLSARRCELEPTPLDYARALRSTHRS